LAAGLNQGGRFVINFVIDAASDQAAFFIDASSSEASAEEPR
jgi:hypothetical protein